MHVLLATDADYVVNEVTAALAGPDVSFTVVGDGRAVSTVVAARPPDIAVLDLQVGSMGGMAIAMALRLDESVGALAHVPVLMLLDRAADVHLAKRSGADGWLVKPLNPLTLHRVVDEIVNPPAAADASPAAADDSAEAIAATAG